MILIVDFQFKIKNANQSAMRFWNVDIHVLKNVFNAKIKYSMEIVTGNAEK